MVVSAARGVQTPALVVPDEQTWTMAGADPAALGLRPVFAPGGADRVLVPDCLPQALDEALRTCLAELRPGVEIERRPLPGLEAREPAAAGEDGHAGHAPDGSHTGHAGHAPDGSHTGHTGHAPDSSHTGHGGHAPEGSHTGHTEHGGHAPAGDHGDMMAIVGEPSADGLVMEPIELRFGPLGTPLPGGLLVEVTLDGDVVAESTVHPLLRGSTDLLAPVASSFAGKEAPRVSPRRRLAALETERAVSHLAWLRSLARLLGWSSLADRCTAA
ncbi:MAG: hypothetical protein ACRDL0_10660, partial [Thermoleophilaceae bacterium]